MTVFKKILVSVLFQAAFAGVLSAQSVPDAITPSSMYVGAQPIAVNPDYGCQKGGPFSCWNNHMYGVEIYAGKNQLWRRLGVEGDARLLTQGGINSELKEYSYIAGPTYHALGSRNFTFDIAAQAGLGRLTPPKGFGSTASYFVFSPSGRVEQQVTRSISIRYEYEYQFWPQFAGKLGVHGLTPNGFGIGATYHLHPRVF